VEALAAVREMDFEVVVVDYLMPKMSGGEFYRRLEIERPDLAPCFLFMTGDVLSERTLVDIETSGCRVLVKPFGLPELTNAVSEILRKRARTESVKSQDILGTRVAG
jgi:DNA-binding response OmpR family regulator